ncbi:prolyl oligopeptidase family serine peptidase [Acidisoma cellulosilytica]|uniref:Prolyl oligopeptidase family serine peptidase n=1 Tax=Acidisoma cellulosilyticum TaxID=2802395 RepID=A0A963Z057_9PROT|nr:prolyl oligopeptidase family serine peptidase [Acidisoma cellulosilyticum]MCB8879413.1 prolyl oligopeptidase family serine peptidase [Acidisoma cellulosilyticum]
MAHLTGPTFGPAAGGAPRQLVVICHGLGANGDNLIPLAPALSAALPHALFVAPHAPDPCDLVSPEDGLHARQWFSLRDWSPAAMAAGVRSARPSLDRFLDETLAAHAIPDSDYALVGFSQGAMMSLFTGLRRSIPPRAILAYAGILLDPDKLADEIACRPPVLLVHGDADNVVSVEFSRMAADILKRQQVPFDLLIEPGLGHAIDAAGVAAGTQALAQAFAGG